MDQANRLSQAAHYEEAGLLLSRLIGEAQRATRELPRGDRRGAFGVLAQTYHITAKTLTNLGTSSFGPASLTRQSVSRWPPHEL